jgi:hypothetical protein
MSKNTTRLDHDKYFNFFDFIILLFNEHFSKKKRNEMSLTRFFNQLKQILDIAKSNASIFSRIFRFEFKCNKIDVLIKISFNYSNAIRVCFVSSNSLSNSSFFVFLRKFVNDLTILLNFFMYFE